ncbi:MAG: sugar transferase [Lachnospiraceae bacterium]|nr:sugar transferase [Lachnospiraceae bacterium]
MNKKYKVLETYGLWLIDIVSIVISFIIATYMRFGNFRDMGDKRAHFMVCVIFVLFATMYHFFIPWNHDFMKRRYYSELWAITKYTLIVMMISLVAVYYMRWVDTFARFVWTVFPVINIGLTFIFHMVAKNALKSYYRREGSKVKLLVITQKNLRESVEKKLKQNLELNYEILDILLTEEIPNDFFETARQMALDEVFIYAPDWSQRAMNEVVSFFFDMGVTCHYCVELSFLDSKRSTVGDFADFSVMSYNHFQSSYKRLLIKRVMDIFGGLIGCIVTLILTIFVAPAIKLDSKGPVFFSQTRIGRNGRRFRIYKFRSMYTDAEERKAELTKENEMTGPMFKIKDDPRITKVGRFIRKTSIDEFPQFFNVLKGDMSLVGTRPPTEDEFEKYNQVYRRRLSMTPGLTGLWQVSGRSHIDDFDEVVKYDLEYIDNWSLGLDMKILLKTVWVVFTGKGSE